MYSYRTIQIFTGKTGSQKTLAAIQTMAKKDAPSPTGTNQNSVAPPVENSVPTS